VLAAALERLARDSRVVVAAALAAVALAAWAYVIWLAASMAARPDMPGMDMSGMDMSGMDMSDMLAPGARAWTVADAALMFVMWAVMMVAMMLPSAAPMILIYARVAAQAAEQGKPFASAAWFASGYLAAWFGFSALATAAQWLLERFALLTPMMASATPVLGAALLIAAGLYQWTPLKDACLSQCQAPLAFIQRHGGFRRTAQGSLALGARHGLYCIGCCWALMALLFVGGVMNLLWVAGIAAFVLLEKLTPQARWLPRVAGVGLMAAGVAMLAPFAAG
jgi:predicted metal-binding membrane protein